jgi:hypothetical protein
MLGARTSRAEGEGEIRSVYLCREVVSRRERNFWMQRLGVKKAPMRQLSRQRPGMLKISHEKPVPSTTASSRCYECRQAPRLRLSSPRLNGSSIRCVVFLPVLFERNSASTLFPNKPTRDGSIALGMAKFHLPQRTGLNRWPDAMQKKRRNGRASTKTSVEDEIAHLRGLDLGGLCARWKSVFQRPAPAHLTRHLLFAIMGGAAILGNM